MIEALRFAGAVAFVACVGFYLARHRRELRKLYPRLAWRSLRRLGTRGWIRLAGFSTWLIVILLCIIPASGVLAEWLAGGPIVSVEEHPVTVTASISLPLAFALMAILPVFEEFLWRGIVLERLRTRGTINAVIISSFGFGLAHLLNAGTWFWAFVPPTIAGFVFCAAYLADGLRCAILTHSGYNIVALGIAFL